ncbi:MAG: radical SAM protein [Acidobacteriota bacterium]
MVLLSSVHHDDSHPPDEILSLPILLIFPHSRCDCRCIMCDIWRDRRVQEISADEIRHLLTEMEKLAVRRVVFSGGEPLLHSNLFALCELLKSRNVQTTLLSTGRRLKECARQVVQWVDDVILSLDGPAPVHDRIRRVRGAYGQMVEAIHEIRRHNPLFPIACRSTVQRNNFRYLRDTLKAARLAGFDSISFLAVDLVSSAFNRADGWGPERQSQISLSNDEISELESEIESLIGDHADEIRSGFLKESPAKLRRIVDHFRAHLGLVDPVAPRCNAPWVSAVIEADGTVRPCFFHGSLGNVREASLTAILNAPSSLRFRQDLDVSQNPVCQRCVCSLYWEDESGSQPAD